MATAIYIMPSFDKHYFRMGGDGAKNFYNPECIFDNVIVLSMTDYDNERIVEEITIIDINVNKVNYFKEFFFYKLGLHSKFIKKLNSTLIKLDINDTEIIVIQRYGAPMYHGLFAKILSDKLGSKLVSTVQNMYSLFDYGNSIKTRIKRALESRIENEVYKSSDRILLVSNYLKKEITDSLQEKSFVISNKINDSLINKNYQDEELLVKDYDEYFLSVGRIIHQKNYPLMIQAYRQYRDQGGKFSYIILGDGPEKNNIERLLIENDLFEHVKIKSDYLDFNQLKDYYKNAKTLYFCSSHEGQGRVVYEALLNGCSVVTSIEGPMKEMIFDGYNGFLADHTNVNDMARALMNAEKNTINANECINSGKCFLTSNVNKVEYEFYKELIAS